MQTGINRKDPSTLHNKNFPRSYSVGIVKEPTSGFGHSRFAMECRKSCFDVFESYYSSTIVNTTIGNESGKQSLVCSFDGGTLYRNYTLKEYGLQKTKTSETAWPHVDINPHTVKGLPLQKDFPIIQGVLLLTDSNEQTGGFVCVDKSHKNVEEVWKHTKQSLNAKGQLTKTGNYLPLDMEQKWCQDFVYKSKNLVRIASKAGDLLLFNSSTTHYTIPPQVTPTTKEPFIRIGCYVCFYPRLYIYHHIFSKKNKEDKVEVDKVHEPYIDKRQNFIKNGWLSNHWPLMQYMEKARQTYPRAKTSLPIQSCALPYNVLMRDYFYIL